MYEIYEIVGLGFYIFKSGKYLHNDYIWRPFTMNGDIYSGYFKTKREAEETLLIVLADDKEKLAVLRAIYILHGRNIDKVIKYSQTV